MTTHLSISNSSHGFFLGRNAPGSKHWVCAWGADGHLWGYRSDMDMSVQIKYVVDGAVRMLEEKVFISTVYLLPCDFSVRARGSPKTS